MGIIFPFLILCPGTQGQEGQTGEPCFLQAQVSGGEDQSRAWGLHPGAKGRHKAWIPPLVKVEFMTMGSWMWTAEVWGPGSALLPMYTMTLSKLFHPPTHLLLGLSFSSSFHFIVKLCFLS